MERYNYRKILRWGAFSILGLSVVVIGANGEEDSNMSQIVPDKSPISTVFDANDLDCNPQPNYVVAEGPIMNVPEGSTIVPGELVGQENVVVILPPPSTSC